MTVFTPKWGTIPFRIPRHAARRTRLGTFYLSAGDYPVHIVFYECSGGSSLEFFAAAGSKSVYDSTFRLVGDTGNGGLAVKSLPGTGGTGVTLAPSIKTDMSALMYGKASSAYARFTFTVADPGVHETLTLRMKYNDGFVAWLNGVEVARRNCPAVPQWNSTATASRTGGSSVLFEDMDMTSHLGLLQTGTNVLAIHGLNDYTNSSTFLLTAELVENKVVGLTNHYFATPTPGSANDSASYAAVANLKFTPGRGWYENTNLFVTITSATPAISIRYTTNGSAPSPTNGLLYSGPISIGCTVPLRAIGYRSAFTPTEVETHTYIFLDQVQRQTTNSNYPGGSAGDYSLNATPDADLTVPGEFQEQPAQHSDAERHDGNGRLFRAVGDLEQPDGGRDRMGAQVCHRIHAPGRERWLQRELRDSCARRC